MLHGLMEGAMLAEAGKCDATRIRLFLRMIDIVYDNAPTEVPWETFFLLEHDLTM